MFPTVSEMRLDGFELPSSILQSSICFFIVSRSNFGLFSNGSLLLCLVGSPNSYFMSVSASASAHSL